MVQNASGSKPDHIQGSSQKTAFSRKPSPYVFDSDGDTRLILNTYKAQSFNWRGERVCVGQETSTTEYLEGEKRGMKVVEEVLPPPSLPPALLESAVSVPMSYREANDERSAGFDGTDANSSTMRVQDWYYGERTGIIPDQVEIRMLVSGKHLALASSYFEKMFAGSFTEANTDHSGLRQITASDWDPEAFIIILTIIHGYHRDVPRSLSLEMLAKLAMIVDYYGCHESIELYADIWLANLKSQISTVYGRDCILCIFISWVFIWPDMFQEMTGLALRHSGKLIETEDIPIPADLLKHIDKARQDFLSDIFSAIYDLLDLLQEEPECSYECSSMLLGILTKELRKYGILSPRSAQPFYGLSIEGSKRMIKGLKRPRWYSTNSGRYDPIHNCTIQQKLSPALDKAEKGLRVFNLQDFQIAKGRVRS